MTPPNGLGPSAQDSHHTIISLKDTQSSNDIHVELTFYGAVLHLRGDTVTRQPHVSGTGNVLLWNGEIFDGIPVDLHQNDGQVLMDQLEGVALQSNGKAHSTLLLWIMAKIEGPYAFVYFHVGCVLIDRDPTEIFVIGHLVPVDTHNTAEQWVRQPQGQCTLDGIAWEDDHCCGTRTDLRMIVSIYHSF